MDSKGSHGDRHKSHWRQLMCNTEEEERTRTCECNSNSPCHPLLPPPSPPSVSRPWVNTATLSNPKTEEVIEKYNEHYQSGGEEEGRGLCVCCCCSFCRLLSIPSLKSLLPPVSSHLPF